MRQIATLSSPEYRSATGRGQSGYPLETHQISIEIGTPPVPEGYDFNPPSRNAGESLEYRPNLTPFESGRWPIARGCWRKGADRLASGRGDGLGIPWRWAPGWRRGTSLAIAATPGTPGPGPRAPLKPCYTCPDPPALFHTLFHGNAFPAGVVVLS